MRAYTVRDIEHMRESVRALLTPIDHGEVLPPGHVRVEGPSLNAAIEDQLRTYITASVDPLELRNTANARLIESRGYGIVGPFSPTEMPPAAPKSTTEG